MLLLGATIEDESSVPLFGELRSDCCRLSIAAIFANHLDLGQLAAFVRLGISGYFVWSDIQQAVMRPALEALLSGDILIGSHSPALAFIASPSEGEYTGVKKPITSREGLVLRGLSQGLTRREIVVSTRLSERTIDRTIELLERKLDAHDSFVLGMRATLLRLIP